MSILSDICQRKVILSGLLIHFVLWWIFAYRFLHRLEIPFYALLGTPLVCLSGCDSIFAGAPIAFIGLSGLTILSLRQTKARFVILTHIFLAFYWCYSILIWIHIAGLAG